MIDHDSPSGANATALACLPVLAAIAAMDRGAEDWNPDHCIAPVDGPRADDALEAHVVAEQEDEAEPELERFVRCSCLTGCRRCNDTTEIRQVRAYRTHGPWVSPEMQEL